MKQYKEFISDKELYICPISETIIILPYAEALKILRMDVLALDGSFYTQLHKEAIHFIQQRRSMAKHILLSPNICAELFTLNEYIANNRYIVNKLVGRYDLDDKWIEDFEPIERQTYRQILKALDRRKKDCLIFFWAREINLLEFIDGQWRFDPDSPAYKSLLDFYGKFKLVESV